MKYKIVKETKPSLSTFGKYKAVAVHERTLDTKKIIEEVKERNGFLSEGTVEAVLIGLSEVINRHLRNGDKVVESVISADVNEDGTVDVADIASIIDIMAGHTEQ